VTANLTKRRTSQRIEVINDHGHMIDAIVRFIKNSNSELDACLSNYTLILTTDMEVIQAPKRAARQRGVRLKYITEITQENLPFVKRQLDMVDELRHLEGIRGNFILSDGEFIASPDITPEHPITDGIHSNTDKLLKQERYTFETLWSHALPAQEKIEQLERGFSSSVDTEPSHAEEKKKKVIDRFYICSMCGAVFVYKEDAEEHKVSAGHREMDELPISG
jgi:hypothetical protein